MKAKLIMSVAFLLLAGNGYLFADEGQDKNVQPEPAAVVGNVEMMENTAGDKTAASIEVRNKKCPVSGEKVGEMGDIVKIEYNGKIYNLCCPMCIKDFKKDPEKYTKIAEDEVKAAAEKAQGAAKDVPSDPAAKAPINQ